MRPNCGLSFFASIASDQLLRFDCCRHSWQVGALRNNRRSNPQQHDLQAKGRRFQMRLATDGRLPRRKPRELAAAGGQWQDAGRCGCTELRSTWQGSVGRRGSQLGVCMQDAGSATTQQLAGRKISTPARMHVRLSAMALFDWLWTIGEGW